MSLQDDIENLRVEWNGSDQELNFDAFFAMALQRDYLVVDRPEVADIGGRLWVDDIRYYADAGADYYRTQGVAYLAIAEVLQSREAAALQARRDELVHQYGYDLTYADQPPMVKDLINRLISANADHTVAGERS